MTTKPQTKTTETLTKQVEDQRLRRQSGIETKESKDEDPDPAQSTERRNDETDTQAERSRQACRAVSVWIITTPEASDQANNLFTLACLSCWRLGSLRQSKSDVSRSAASVAARESGVL